MTACCSLGHWPCGRHFGLYITRRSHCSSSVEEEVQQGALQQVGPVLVGLRLGGMCRC